MNECGETDRGQRRALLASAAILYLGLLIGALIWTWLRSGWILPESMAAGRVWESLGLGAGLAVSVIALTGLLMRKQVLHWFAVEVRSLLGPLGWGTALILGLLSGVGEEVFFRGAMQPAVGYVLTSLVFGLIHIGPDRRYLFWTVFAVVMGFLLGGIQLVTGSLAGPIFAHVVINTVNLRRIGRLEFPETPASLAHEVRSNLQE